MKSMYIGSGDVSALMSGTKTEAHKKLLRQFVSDECPYRNAVASPIDALRTGAIIENQYYDTLPIGYFPQFVVWSEEMNVFRATLDYALLYNGDIVDFDEVKTINFEAFLKLIEYKDQAYEVYIPIIRKQFKKYYNQIQEQLYCSKLDQANLVFVAVYSYDDEENFNREIKDNDIIKFRIKRDEQVIAEIKTRGSIFQTIKNHYTSCQ